MEVRKRNIAILGSTGSIGTQALDVISRHSDRFAVYALVANNQVGLLIRQARTFHPEVVVIANESHYPQLKEALSDLPIKVWCGSNAIEEVVQDAEVDMVLTAMVGFSGLKPTIRAIQAGKAIALANKVNTGGRRRADYLPGAETQECRFAGRLGTFSHLSMSQR